MEWIARIVRSEGVVDEKSRMTYAVARVVDPYRLHSEGAELPIGTFVSASVRGASAENIFQVPRALLRGSDELVFVDDESMLRIRKVNIVRADSRSVYIGIGAAPGERVVITALETPVNGMPVRVAGDEPPATQVATGEGD